MLGRAREDGGFTMVEMLVASAMAIALIGVSVSLFTSALSSEPRSTSRSDQIESGRIMLERITRELRQGEAVGEGSGADQLTITTLARSACEGGGAGGESCEVTYSCAAASAGMTCSRDVDGESVQLVDGLESSQVFSYLPETGSPAFVEVTLEFPRAEGGEAVTLSDGVAIRNLAPVEAEEEEE